MYLQAENLVRHPLKAGQHRSCKPPIIPMWLRNARYKRLHQVDLDAALDSQDDLKDALDGTYAG
jgi:hypothetical protein